jgi:enoyl-CoA hydratase
MKTDDKVLCRITPPLAQIVFNRPEVGNAIDSDSIRGLDRALTQVTGDRTIHCLALTGSGNRLFVSGGDLKEFDQFQDPEEPRQMSLAMKRVLARIDALDIPVVGAMNGDAYGGGCEILLACDYVIAREGTRLAFRQTAMGLSTGWGAATRLTRRVGRPQAIRILTTAATLEMNEALELGLVQEIVPGTNEDLQGRVKALSEQIASNAPLAIRACKRAVVQSESMTLSDSIFAETDLFTITWNSRDHQEAVRAFFDKRSPDFRGE